MRELDKTKSEKKLYFNKYEFLKISELYKVDPYSSLSRFHDYLEKYPSDNSAKSYYISNLIALGDFEKAEEELNKLEIELNRNSLYHFDEERARMLDHHIKICKIKLYLYQNKIEEAITLYYENFNEFSYLGKDIITYFEKLRGTLNIKNKKSNSYMIRQIYDYQEEDFRDHLKKHLADYNNNNRKISVSYFNPDFPVDKVILEIKKYIPSNIKLCYGFFENMYVFKYDQCGRDNNKLVDYFKIFTFNDSQKFITMCPSSGCEQYRCVDLNYLKEKEDIKVLEKRPSQIDKFRQRYNIK